jgi:hypothetical protein
MDGDLLAVDTEDDLVAVTDAERLADRLGDGRLPFRRDSADFFDGVHVSYVRPFPYRGQFSREAPGKVFWFFFSKKNCFLPPFALPAFA